MAKNRNPNSPEVIAERLRMGRGRGRGRNFRPWITTHDFHSNGIRFRVWCHLTKRVHHLFSLLEYYLFLLFAADPTVTDIREQFPFLDFERVADASDRVRMEYPNSLAGSRGNVLTSDFVVTRKIGAEWWDEPYSAKHLRDTQDDSFKHRKRLGEIYWEGLGCTETLLTELNAPYERVRSADWILQATANGFLSSLPESQRLEIARILREAISDPHDHLDGVAIGVDDRLGLEGGTSLDICRWMLASRQWIAANDTPPFPSVPLALVAL